MICNPNWLMMRVLGLFEQLRQFRDIDRDPPRLTAREQLGQMSAFPSKADIGTWWRDVRFVPKADILRCGRTQFDHFVGGRRLTG